MIESVSSNGAYRLAKPDGEVLMASKNSKFLKKYYPKKNPWGNPKKKRSFRYSNTKHKKKLSPNTLRPWIERNFGS